MNVGLFIPITGTVAQLPIASTLDGMSPFETLMPQAEGGKIKGALQSEAVPVMSAIAASADSNMPPASHRTPELLALSANAKGNSARHAAGNPVQPALAIIAPQVAHAMDAARPSSAKAIDLSETEAVEIPQPSDLSSFGPNPVEPHLARPHFPLAPFVELRLPTNNVRREPEVASSLALQPIGVVPEKLAILPLQPQPAFEVAQSAATALAVTPAEPVASGQLELARNMLWLDQLAHEIVAVASHDGRLKFSLSPATLGNLDIVISTQADGVNIQLQPSTEAAARIFATEQAKLSEELRQSGIKLTNTDLLNGQQMGSTPDQSQAHRSNLQPPVRISGQTDLKASLNRPAMQPQSGRFA